MESRNVVDVKIKLWEHSDNNPYYYEILLCYDDNTEESVDTAGTYDAAKKIQESLMNRHIYYLPN